MICESVDPKSLWFFSSPEDSHDCNTASRSRCGPVLRKLQPGFPRWHDSFPSAVGQMPTLDPKMDKRRSSQIAKETWFTCDLLRLRAAWSNNNVAILQNDTFTWKILIYLTVIGTLKNYAKLCDEIWNFTHHAWWHNCQGDITSLRDNGNLVRIPHQHETLYFYMLL